MSEKGRFSKGHVPWNKEKKGIHLSPKSEFKKGEREGNKNNTWKGGIQKPKADCTYLWVSANKRVRRPRKVYETFYGQIPEGYVIYHIDGNNDNDHPSNLEAISRLELLRRNNKGEK